MIKNFFIFFLFYFVDCKEIVKNYKDLIPTESSEHSYYEPQSFNKKYSSNSYEEKSNPEPYLFTYDVQDNDNNKQFRKETSDGNVVKGSYGYTDANGLYRHVEYTADAEHGFRAKIRSNEPGMEVYTPDNSLGSYKSNFPADVILEVNEGPNSYSNYDHASPHKYYNEKPKDYQRSKSYQSTKGGQQYEFSATNQHSNYLTEDQNYNNQINFAKYKNQNSFNNKVGKDIEDLVVNSYKIDDEKNINNSEIKQKFAKRKLINSNENNSNYYELSETNPNIAVVKDNLSTKNQTSDIIKNLSNRKQPNLKIAKKIENQSTNDFKNDLFKHPRRFAE